MLYNLKIVSFFLDYKLTRPVLNWFYDSIKTVQDYMKYRILIRTFKPWFWGKVIVKNWARLPVTDYIFKGNLSIRLAMTIF